MLLALCPYALALNPALDVSQYAHASWKYRDGFTRGIIYDVSQTPDGFLWLATEFGLVRFDGVKPIPWEFPGNQALPSNNVRKLFVDRDGTLWISTINGFASWKNGKFTQYPELSGFAVGRAMQDHEGSVWAAARSTSTTTAGKLCEIRDDRTKCFGESVLGPAPISVYEDGKRRLWVGTRNGVWLWKPGKSEFHAIPNGNSAIQDMVEDQNGALLVPARGAVWRLIEGKLQMGYPFPARLRQLPARMLRDRDGGLWAGTLGGGIVHFHQDRTDVFSQSDGLTGDNVLSFFEDREGNIWVATANGLDRFREIPIVTYTARQGLSNAPETGVLAARDGSVWFDTDGGGLNRLDRTGVTVYSNHVASPANNRPVRIGGLPDHRAALFEGAGGRIWISSTSGVGYLENVTYIPTAAPGGVIYALTEDNHADLWIANPEKGLFRLSRGNAVQKVPWETFGREGPGGTLTANLSQGGIWIGFENGGIAWFRDGRVQASYTAADGLGQGRVNDLRFDHAGTLWIATEGGLSLFKGGRLSTITKEDGLPCDGVHWTMPDDLGSVWMMTPCGLARAKLSELESWSTGRKIETTVFGSSDGLSLRALAGVLQPNVGKSPDGRLWFWNGDGIGMVDPRHLPFNKLRPPVQIEQIIADRKTYAAGAKLPALVRNVEIDYTALSFVAPEKNQFRYKLEGRDRDWQDAGNRRQAFYDDLPPRNYRFRVMAANNDGVWNEAGASLDFSVAPAYYQTTWFYALVAAAALALLGGLYQLRLLYLKRQFNIRFEERVGERTRIARDLHDTLLQSFQGVLLKFHAVMYALPDRPADARKGLESAIEQARAAITEGRDAVQGLRSSVVVKNDLARAITTFGEGLNSDQDGRQAPDFRVHVEGTSRDLAPLVRDEVYRIAGEALRNAFRHGSARRIEVEIHYEKWLLRLRIRDDGKGIDPQVLSAGGRTGHHGLPGMRERAELVGGKLAVWSELDSGTEIELTVPAAVAYAKVQAAQVDGQGNLR